METVESPLEVLSRAATMLQHCHPYKDTEDTSNEDRCSESSSPGSTPSSKTPAPKQLPTAKWKRDRRSSTRLPDYKPRDGTTSNGGSKAASRSNSFKEQPTSLVEDATIVTRNNLARTESASKGDLTASGIKCDAEIPIDMSVSGKPRGSPPPYSQAVNAANAIGARSGRPSVIARAAAATTPAPAPSPLTPNAQTRATGSPASLAMCDPVIDEHFRRSLGADYMALFANKNNNNQQTTEAPVSVDRGSSPIVFASDPCAKYLTPSGDSPVEKPVSASPTPSSERKVISVQMEIDDEAGLSVDDHFAKALGDTWKKLQENQHKGNAEKSQLSNESASSNKDDAAANKILSRRGVVI